MSPDRPPPASFFKEYFFGCNPYMFDLVRQKTAGHGPVLQRKLTQRKLPSPSILRSTWTEYWWALIQSKRRDTLGKISFLLFSDPLTPRVSRLPAVCMWVCMCVCVHMQRPDGPSFFQIKAFSPVKNDCPDKS